MARQRFLMTLPLEIWEQVERARGEIPRTQWVEAAIRRVLSPESQEWRATVRATRQRRAPAGPSPEPEVRETQIGDERPGGCPWHAAEGTGRYDGHDWFCTTCGRRA
jgi:hypothetical protein